MKAQPPDTSIYARFGEPAKLLPILFVCSLISSLWFIFVWWHCIPLMLEPGKLYRAWIQLSLFNTLVLLLIINYAKCIFVHPGTIPQEEEAQKSWEVDHAQDQSKVSQLLGAGFRETKRSGQARTCKWCNKYKPDRAHHCRVCRSCVLRMDHHCPWIYNCVGFRNHKYFVLLLVYSVLALNMIIWTMMGSLSKSIRDDTTPFVQLFSLLFGESLACMLCLVTTLFLCFHIYLMRKAMTTIEFCEKSKVPSHKANQFDRGPLGNMKAVLGEDMAFWLLPCAPPSGDGLSFITEETPIRVSQDVDEVMPQSVIRRCVS
jgi:hypothetical protein